MSKRVNCIYILIYILETCLAGAHNIVIYFDDTMYV